MFQPHCRRFTLSTAWQAMPARQLGVCEPVCRFSTMARAWQLKACLKLWGDNCAYSLTPHTVSFHLWREKWTFPEGHSKAAGQTSTERLLPVAVHFQSQCRQAASTLKPNQLLSISTYRMRDILPDLQQDKHTHPFSSGERAKVVCY